MQTRKEQFLALAREAEKTAAEVADPELKEGWLKVAQGYRDLAASAQD